MHQTGRNCAGINTWLPLATTSPFAPAACMTPDRSRARAGTRSSGQAGPDTRAARPCPSYRAVAERGISRSAGALLGSVGCHCPAAMIRGSTLPANAGPLRCRCRSPREPGLAWAAGRRTPRASNATPAGAGCWNVELGAGMGGAQRPAQPPASRPPRPSTDRTDQQSVLCTSPFAKCGMCTSRAWRFDATRNADPAARQPAGTRRTRNLLDPFFIHIPRVHWILRTISSGTMRQVCTGTCRSTPDSVTSAGTRSRGPCALSSATIRHTCTGTLPTAPRSPRGTPGTEPVPHLLLWHHAGLRNLLHDRVRPPHALHGHLIRRLLRHPH